MMDNPKNTAMIAAAVIAALFCAVMLETSFTAANLAAVQGVAQ